MRLRRLEVEHFAGITKAEVQFGPGLNLLHGPNELGKSTLLQAIRAALLLPDNSSAHKDFIDWHTDESPRVRLEFETEQDIWRVDKRFGKGRSSVLEFSKDGTSYSMEARGREVDGRLRELLAWGLSSPGGAGRTRGYPSSFLTTALLGAQGKVDEVFEKGLEDDPDDSGRQLLTEALQALAEDPLLRTVLDRTQARVREAYTTTGRKSSRKDSPWQRLRERRLAAEKRRTEVRTLVESSESAKGQIEEQQAEVDASRQRLERTVGILEQIETAWQQGVESREAAERAEVATTEVARVQALLDAVTDTENRLGEARAMQEALEAAVNAAEERLRNTASKREETKERLRDLQSDDAEQSRKLREQELDATRLGLEARQHHAQTRQEHSERVRDLKQKANDLEREIATSETEINGWRQELTELDEEIAALGETKVKAERSRLAETWLGAMATVEQAKARLEEVEDLKKKAASLRSEALELEEIVARGKLPSSEDLHDLRKAETDLRVAEEKLAVGLSLTLEPKRPLKATVETDGELRQVELTEVESFTAESVISLDLPDLALHVRGGSESTRTAAASLRHKWQSLSGPLFERTGATSLDQVQRQLGEADEKLDRCRSLRSEAETLDARAQGAGDVESALRECTERLEASEAKVREALPEDCPMDEAREWPSPAASAVDPDRLTAELGERGTANGEVKSKLDRAGGLQESKRQELASSRKDVAAAAEGLEGEWAVVLEGARGELVAIAAQVLENEIALRDIREGATAQTGEAENDLILAEEEHKESVTALERANLERGEGRQLISRLEGELAPQKAAAEKEDLAAAKAALELRNRELAERPKPPQNVGDEQREEARETVNQAQAKLRADQDEMRRFEGALGQVGGQYVEEQLEQAEEAVRAVDETEREVELDYGAWQLLLNTLRAAESESVVHLGKILVEPVEARMSELTGGRCGAPTIGPKLGTDGITMAGARRPLDSLSVGAREQLATLFRLTIAEKLGTAVVLDDQLVQSDPARMRFFGELMRECGREFQILVLTCQPDEYDFRPEDGVVVTDLEKLIVRSGQPAVYVTEAGQVERVDDGTRTVDLTTRVARVPVSSIRVTQEPPPTSGRARIQADRPVPPQGRSRVSSPPTNRKWPSLSMENQGLTARSAKSPPSEDASDLDAWERGEIDGSAFTGECLVNEISDGTRVACDLTGVELLVADVNADPARKRHELIDHARSGDAGLRHAIAAAVFEYQPHFCREGIRGLLPLSARQVADYLATHESTVSRAIKDFFIETPLGVFPLRFFFSPGVRREGGGEISARAVRQELKEIIQEESSESPLTDEELANALRRRGYGIARRTIAKYRQSLGVPDSQMRRS